MARPVGERLDARTEPRRSARLAWRITWGAATAINLGIVLSLRDLGPPSPLKGSAAIVAQLAATVALLMAVGFPAGSAGGAQATRRGPFSLAIVLAVLVLFPLGAAGLVVMAPVGLVAVVVLAVLRPALSRRDVGYALGLALLATAGGLVEWSAGMGNLATAAIQLPMVTVALLAVLAVIRRLGWPAGPIAPVKWLTARPRDALTAFAIGFLLAAPWALGNIAAGPFERDRVSTGWQVLAALRPGVAEEVWIRALSIAVLCWVFCRYARPRPALVAAALVGTYWFAFLHAPFNPVVVILLGTIQLLPMTLVWLHRGLEAAIGFHLCVDLVRFLAAYLAFAGVWFR